MSFLLKLIAILGASVCVTLAVADAECPPRGPIAIEEQHCLGALNALPRPNGLDSIIFNGTVIPSYFRTCKLKLTNTKGDPQIYISKTAVEKAFHDAWNLCPGYTSIDIDGVELGPLDNPVCLEILAYKDQPSVVA